MLCSRYRTQAPRDDSLRCRISSRSCGRPGGRRRCLPSAGRCGRADDQPPVKACASRNSRTITRRRLRSSRDSIFLDTPMWSTVGMKTHEPARIVTCDVSARPSCLAAPSRPGRQSPAPLSGALRFSSPPTISPGRGPVFAAAVSSSSLASLSNSSSVSITSATRESRRARGRHR